MYCEIVVYHRKRIAGEKLAALLGQASGVNVISVNDAYQKSAVYRGKGLANSLFASDIPNHCFAILQQVDRDQSRFHIEAEKPISVMTLLQTVEQYAVSLLADMKAKDSTRAYRVSRLVIRPCENDFSESGFEGRLVTLRQGLADINLVHEVLSKLATFLTTFILVRFALTKDTIPAAGWSFAIAIVFTVVEIVIGWFRGRGKIVWKRR